MDYVEEVGIYKENEDKARQELQNSRNDLRNVQNENERLHAALNDVRLPKESLEVKYIDL